MSPLPGHIKVNGRTYQLKLRTSSRMPDSLGLCHTDKGLIEIRKDQEAHEMRDTVLHETIHALLASQGREYGGDVEEMYVRAIATGLLGVLKDNPPLVHWLTETK